MNLNQLKVAWRAIKKQPFLNALNTIGLAIGIAGTLLITLYVNEEWQRNRVFDDYERIHRVNVDMKFGGPDRRASQVSAPMAGAILNDIPTVESVVRFRPQGSATLNKVDSRKLVLEEETTFVDSTLVSFFGLNTIQGDAKTMLTRPNTVVLTQTAARKHFGDQNAIGEQIVLNENQSYTVTGVIEDLPKNSFLEDYSVFMSLMGMQDALEHEWGNHNYNTYLKLRPNVDANSIKEPIHGMMEKYLIPFAQRYFPGVTLEQFEASGNYVRYTTTALKDIHLHSKREHQMSENGDIKNIYILVSIAIFLLLLASINFMNLSTAYSLKRAKEVGIRKTLGSKRGALIGQFLTESTLVTLGSVIAAIILAELCLPWFNDLTGRQISFPWHKPLFYLVIVAGTLLLALISGSYPAFVMSRFIPTRVLKGGSQTGGSNIRSGLVVFQFSIAIFLIIGTLIVGQQIKYMQNKDLGYSKDQVLLIDHMDHLGDKAQAFKEEVKAMAQVNNATISGFVPTPSYRQDSSYFLEENMNQDAAINMQGWTVDHDYMNTLNLQLITGRGFDREISTDSAAMVVNEAALREMGLQPNEVLGKRISYGLDLEELEFFTVIGVIKDFHYETMRNVVRPLCLRLGDSGGSLVVKLSSDNYEQAISQINGIWNSKSTGLPLDYRFMDDSFNRVYQNERRLANVFMIFTGLSLFIACLGLFGLAAYNAQKRVKEIGVRKVLGASVAQITYELSFDFLKLVGIAILIGMPIGWFVMDRWLQDFNYRISVGVGTMIIAACLAIAIALFTVGFQSIRAAMSNPVKSLRTE